METADRRAQALVGQAAYGVCVEYRHLGAMTHLCCQAWNEVMEQEQRNGEWRYLSAPTPDGDAGISGVGAER